MLPLPAFTDNYIWMLHNARQAIVVDPGDATPVLQTLQAQGLQLQAILVTHHHADHVGGVDALRAATGAQVFGPARERIPEPLVRLAQGDTVEVLGLRFSVLDVPGHTAGHIAYYCPDMQGAPLLFCGDTLFSGGCGRLFEGTAAQMHASLQRLFYAARQLRAQTELQGQLPILLLQRQGDGVNPLGLYGRNHRTRGHDQCHQPVSGQSPQSRQRQGAQARHGKHSAESSPDRSGSGTVNA